MRKRTKAILLAIVSAALSCSTYYVAQYDAKLDGGAVELQQKVDTFLTYLEQTAGTPEAAYEKNETFYQDVRTDLRMLRDIAAVQQGNEITVQSLDSIEDNLARLEKIHAEGISAKEISIVRTLFASQFRMLVQFENAKKRKES